VVDIAEAASFYTMFPKEPVGKYLIQVCHNISCALLGADSLIGYLEEKLAIKKGETTSDNMFTLISVECLGGCTAAPMMQINDRYYENLTREKVDKILEDLRNEP
ncbi:MAG: NAD(P)H-dependent oxidoreductase subunit E, partial [Candidatus Zixiibacteriota bacterium]